MLLDWVEYEIRRLPGVIAAGVDDHAITVLVLPDVDADAVRVVIGAMVATAGSELCVRVIGGATRPEKRRHAPPVAAGSVVGIGVMATAAIAVAMTGVPWVPEGPPQRPDSASSTAPAATQSDRGRAAVIPGSQPTWAATEGPWPLPASLASGQPVVLAALRPQSSDVTRPHLEPAIQPAPTIVKSSAPSAAFGPIGSALADPFQLVEIDTVVAGGGTDEEDRRRNRPRRAAMGPANTARHRVRLLGPAHEPSHSQASETRRGGR